MHLFPDADENLSTIYPDYPLANVLVCFGIILVLSIDQIATTCWRRLHPNQMIKIVDSPHDAKTVNVDCSHDHDHAHSINSSPNSESLPVHHSQDHDHEAHHENCGFIACEHGVRAENKGTQKMAGEQAVDSSRAQSLPFDLNVAALELIQEESFKDIVAAYIMEFSIAAHSIIIGVNLGLLGEDDIPSIVALMIALGFHQVSVCCSNQYVLYTNIFVLSLRNCMLDTS